MTEAAYLTQSALRADRAELILEALRQRPPAEADLQASAMVMAGLKMMWEVRGTPAVLDALSRLGPALVEECDPLSAAAGPAATSPASDVQELFASLTAEPEADGRTRADTMMTAATALLIEREGVEGTVAALGRLAERVRASKVAKAHAVAAPPLPPADPVATALAYLRGLPVEVARVEAGIAITAASAFLREVGGMPAVMGPASGVSMSRPTSDHLACAMVDHLKASPRWDAHERARAVVAGAGAYLHEVFGRSYASAALAGALDAAAAYGDEVRGGRDSLDTLH